MYHPVSPGKRTTPNRAGFMLSLLVCMGLSQPVAVLSAAFDPADPIPEGIATGTISVQLTEVADGFVSPVWGTASPADTTRLFIADQTGVLKAIDLGNGDSKIFLDVSPRLVSLGAFGPESFDERGFLGFAFHPDYATNGLLYTYTSEPVSGPADFSTLLPGETANHQTVITEWRVTAPSDPAALVDTGSARELLRIDQPQFNHDGGTLEFDANGYLYISLGDGGAANDVGDGHGISGNGQDPTNPLGAILRIDPRGNSAANGHYGIPTSNPFFGGPQVEEVYAYGFRNPYRISFDRQTGVLWAADVGQNAIEEIDRVTAGGNYGWNHKEGTFFFDAGDASVSDQDPGVPAGLIDPVAQYDHDEGIAIVGGFVYRGSAIPELAGRYVFGDFGNFSADAGRIFYLTADNEIRAFNLGVQQTLPFAVLGFAQDANGEIYMLVNSTGTPFGTTGKVLRLDPPPASTEKSTGGGCMLASHTDRVDPVLPLLLLVAVLGLRYRKMALIW